MRNAPVRVGEPFCSYFRVDSGNGRRNSRWLTRLTSVDPGHLRMTDHPWPTEAQVEVRLSVFEAGGQLFVGAVEIRTAPEPLDLRSSLGLTIPAPPVEPLPVGTDLWRMVPLGSLSREAIQSFFSGDAEAVAASELAGDPEAYARLSDAMASGWTERRRQGRPSKLTPQLLAFVGHAYTTAGPRGGRPAVMRALQYAADRTSDGTALPGMEFLGNGPGGVVTTDQARKAIERWRRSTKEA